MFVQGYYVGPTKRDRTLPFFHLAFSTNFFKEPAANARHHSSGYTVGRMKSAMPLIQITLYYAVVGTSVYGLTLLFPEMVKYLPFGGHDFTSTGVQEFMTGELRAITWEPMEKAIRLSLAMIGVVLMMEPICWIYMGARRRKGREQAFMLTLLLLPVVVAGIVAIVQNSLALAFSLAGIVAGVRFRLTLDDTLDAGYIFTAIAVGLSAGIGALEIGLVVTIFFNYFMLLFWELDYGEEVSTYRWFTRSWMNRQDDEADEDDLPRSY